MGGDWYAHLVVSKVVVGVLRNSRRSAARHGGPLVISWSPSVGKSTLCACASPLWMVLIQLRSPVGERSPRKSRVGMGLARPDESVSEMSGTSQAVHHCRQCVLIDPTYWGSVRAASASASGSAVLTS